VIAIVLKLSQLSAYHYFKNTYNWTWSKLNPKGTPPEKRSGHQAVAIEKKIYILGGSSSSVQFQDLYVLDTELEPPVWSKMNSTLPYPTWNLSACSVIAIPTWKIFTFGGLCLCSPSNLFIYFSVFTKAYLDH